MPELKWTGERVVPHDMHKAVDTYQQHLARYVWALDKVVGKRVIDAACGTGYGTALMASVAQLAWGYDVDIEALVYAVEHYGSEFYRFDLDKKPPAITADIVVSFETIEHLSNPNRFLLWCKSVAPEMVGSFPIACPTKYHKHVWSGERIVSEIKKYFSQIEFYYQDHMNIVPNLFPIPTHGMILFHGKF